MTCSLLELDLHRRLILACPQEVLLHAEVVQLVHLRVIHMLR